MKERPILFSGPMVRAIMEGRKTQTRRVVRDQGGVSDVAGGGIEPTVWWPLRDTDGTYDLAPCPYGEPGDRLWVRETCMLWAVAGRPQPDSPHPVVYADDPEWDELRATNKALVTAGEHVGIPWSWKTTPSIHMPRWASRLTLEVTDVRVERLLEITEADAIAEGIEVDMLCDLLRPAAAKADELLTEHWISGSDDEGSSYCYQCAEKKVSTLVAAGGDGSDLRIGGGYASENDGHRFCEMCGRQLEVTLTAYGIESEVEHFTSNGIRGVEDLRDFLAMIDCGVPRLTKQCGNFWFMPELTGPIARIGFRYLWDQINGSRGYRWDTNSWVWVVEFRKLTP